jgi:hypothetical protein
MADDKASALSRSNDRLVVWPDSQQLMPLPHSRSLIVHPMHPPYHHAY